jgi:hypothetical protein
MQIKGKYKFVQTVNDKIRESDWIHNLIMVNDGNGMNIFIRQLGNNTDYPLAITRAQLGTDNTAVDISQNQGNLPTPEVENILIANRTFIDDDTIEFKFFASDLQVPDDTYNEIRLLAGDQLFARSIISPAFEKATGVDTTIIYQITVSTDES